MRLYFFFLAVALGVGTIYAKPNNTTTNIDKKLLEKQISTYSAKDARLRHFYIDSKSTALWIDKSVDIDKINVLLSIINNSKNHGLSPESFQHKKIKQIVDSIVSKKYSATDYIDALARVETLSTKAAITYVKAIKFGFTNPQRILPNDYFIETVQPDSVYYTYINKLIIASPLKAMQRAQQKSDIYVQMQQKLANLDSLKNEKLEPIATKNGGYKLYDEDINIGRIAKRLALCGYYELQSSDSLNNILSPKLMEAVNTFRRENMYSPEYEIGSTSIAALNKPISSYYKKLQANLERYRWRRKKIIADKRVEVNVPLYYLIGYDGGKAVTEMKVCVGTTTNRTPLMESDINIVNFNPVWNVPTSITRKEMFNSMKKDPAGYLKRRNMTMSKGGKTIDPSSLDWSNMSATTFGYSISQGSGSGNSLGRVKFLFPNRFAVYLHDTPSQGAFGNRIRAVSHGCVRLQKPIDFALYCTSKLGNDLYKDQILYSIDRPLESEEGKAAQKNSSLKKVPNVINLDKKIPLTLDYHTIFFMPNEEFLHYTDDIYNHDSIILTNLGV